MSKKKSLLEDAIADAKAVKDAALSNAKASLEETFGPKLKSMLAAKLAEEAEEDDLDVEDIAEEVTDEGKEDPAEDETPEEELDEKKEDDDENPDDDVDEEIDLDELLNSIDEKKEDDDPAEDETPEEDEAPEEELDEKFDFGKFLEELKTEYSKAKGVHEAKKKSKKEKVELSKDDASAENLQEEVKKLKSLINETNTINAKQLYLNKVLVENTLSDKQKISILEAFDKASNPKEAKLVYNTLSQAFKTNKAAAKKSEHIKESIGLSSKASGTSTKKKIINEDVVDEQKERWQKLAGITAKRKQTNK